MECRYESYLDGRDNKLTAALYMAAAETYYLDRVRVGTWNAPTPEQEEILAMKAQVVELESQAKKAKSEANKTSKKKDKKVL